MTTAQTDPASKQNTRTVRPRLRDDERALVRGLMAKEYRAGAAIRALAAQHELSYGLARTLLLEAGVELRSRRRPARKAGT